MAGESAGDVARQQRAKAERLLRSAERWDRGAEGERATGALLESLRPDGWVIFHDVRWPGRQRANIDHVVVGPPGVFVIDAKNWTGRIEVADNTFRAHGRRQDKVVAAAAEAALAVTSLTSPPAAATTRGVLCFVRQEPVTGWCFDVMMCSTANVRDMLTSRPVVLSPAQIELAATELDLAFQAARRELRRMPSSRATHRPARPSVTARPRAAAPSRRSTRRPRRRSPGSVVVRLVIALVPAAVVLTWAPTILTAIGDQVAPSVDGVASTYATCRELRREHPDGVGTVAGVASMKRESHVPAVLPSVYEANKGLDPDGDGLVCVRRSRARQ